MDNIGELKCEKGEKQEMMNEKDEGYAKFSPGFQSKTKSSWRTTSHTTRLTLYAMVH
jgi:hypothetical protein